MGQKADTVLDLGRINEYTINRGKCRIIDVCHRNGAGSVRYMGDDLMYARKAPKIHEDLTISEDLHPIQAVKDAMRLIEYAEAHADTSGRRIGQR